MANLSWENKVVIYFVCDNWDFVHLGDREDLLQVGGGKHGPGKGGSKGFFLLFFIKNEIF